MKTTTTKTSLFSCLSPYPEERCMIAIISILSLYRTYFFLFLFFSFFSFPFHLPNLTLIAAYSYPLLFSNGNDERGAKTSLKTLRRSDLKFLYLQSDCSYGPGSIGRFRRLRKHVLSSHVRDELFQD